jgi:hypothetical protein
MAGVESNGMWWNRPIRALAGAWLKAIGRMPIILTTGSNRGVGLVIMHSGRGPGACTPDHPLAAEDSVAGMRHVIDGTTEARSGSCLDCEGRARPW